MLLVKPGVRFDVIRPAGFRILSALELLGDVRHIDFTITCGTEGHSPTDPHTRGEAYDVRSHDLTDKQAILRDVLSFCGNGIEVPIADDGGFATEYFWGWLENEGQPTEHFHFQRRHGTVYGPPATVDA